MELEGELKGTVASQQKDIDSFNDETFGDGAIQDDWESSHHVLTGDALGGKSPQLPLMAGNALGGKSPQLPLGDAFGGNSPQIPLALHHVEGGQAPDGVLPDVAQLKIKELWPSSPQSNPRDSIWSSPEIPSKLDQAARLPPGSNVINMEELETARLPPGKVISVEELETARLPPGKVISLEDLERELTSSPPSSSSASVSPRPPTHPQALSPSQSPAHHRPPPGIMERPPPGLPHPLPPRQMHPYMPWPHGVAPFQGPPPHGMPPHGAPPHQGGPHHGAPPLQGGQHRGALPLHGPMPPRGPPHGPMPGYRPMMPPPPVPIRRTGILLPGHLHQPPFPLFPPQLHPLFRQQVRRPWGNGKGARRSRKNSKAH